MQKRNGRNGSKIAVTHGAADTEPARQDCEDAVAEIKRLKLELAKAREELHELTEATTDFMRLML